MARHSICCFLATRVPGLLAVVALGLPVPLAGAEALPIEALARFEAVTSVDLAPDGQHIVALVAAPNQKWPLISVWKTDALDKAPVWIPSEKNRPVFVQFLSDDRIAFITEQEINIDTEKTFTRKLYVTDLTGSRFEEPLRRTGTGNDLVRRFEELRITVEVFNDSLKDENKILLRRVNTDQGVSQIYQLDTRTWKADLIAEDSEKSDFLRGGVNTDTGELLVQRKIENVNGDFWTKVYLRPNAQSPWQYHPALSYALKKRRFIEPVGFDRDPNKLIVLADMDSNFVQVRNYDIRAKTFEPEPLFKNEAFDIATIFFAKDPTTRMNIGPVGVVVAAPSFQSVFVDDYWSKIDRALRLQFGGLTLKYGARLRSKGMALISVESAAQPPEYFLVRTEPQISLTKIGAERPWIDAAKMGASRWVTYTARDGLKIPAILTTPPGWASGNGRIPAVIHPHGGPWSRDDMGWDGSGWVQFLATRGYAVLQPQYRGSEGLGLKLWLAGDENWGLKMQDDKDDGAAWLVDQGIADPNRIAIFGYSYGGFAAIAASVRPNGPYVCALSGAGVASLGRLGNLWSGERLQKQIQGWTVKGMDPMENVAKSDIPILLYHGDRDRQADTDHSRMFYRAMKAAGKDVQYVEIKDMWHTLPWRPEWHRQSLTLIENWLAGPKCFGGPGKQRVAGTTASSTSTTH